MVKIALDPAMYHSTLSVADEVKAVKDAMKETGVTMQTLVPVYNWSSPREDEREAAVRNWRRLLEIATELECPMVNSELSGDPIAPHAFHLSDGAGDVRRMIDYAGDRLRHVHVADVLNHTINNGLRYILNPPGADVRVHQHNEIGNGDVPWDEFFGALRDTGFDGVATVCVFGWDERADEIHRRMLERVQQELAAEQQTLAPATAAR